MAEAELADCVSILCRYGFSPTIEEVKNLVSEYASSNEINVSVFKNGRPGKDWISSFMKRNKLSLKHAEMICYSRKAATENPFIIYEFYEIIEKIIKEKDLSPNKIWNTDESGFPVDPKKCKVISQRGEKDYKVTLGPGRENITTLATCSAAGQALDPLIVFAGKNLQSSWRGDNALANTMYAVSDSGWMTAEIFSSWFHRFTEVVTQRPLLLVFDGHLTHYSLDVIQKGRAEDITIVKLPPHTTDLLQPLDVACFGPIKQLWQKKLNDWISLSGAKEPIKKAQFANMLSDVWHVGLSNKNVVAGFEATGVYPANKEKYPQSRFNPNTLRKYKTWIAAGRPEKMEDIALVECVSPKKTPTKIPTTPRKTPRKTPSKNATPSAMATCTCAFYLELGPRLNGVPPGKRWVATWSLLDAASTPAVGSNGKEAKINKSFEELILSKVKPPKSQTPKKRRKIDLNARVVTSDEFLKGIEDKEKEAEEKKNKKGTKKRKKKQAEDGENELAYIDENEEEIVEASQITDGEESENEIDKNVRATSSVTIDNLREANRKDELRNLIKDVVSTLDDDKKGLFYAVYYGTRYYWGKVQKVFSPDVDDDATDVEFAFLTYKTDGVWEFPNKPDQAIVKAMYVIYGPITPSSTSTKGYKFEGHDDIVRQMQKKIRKLNVYDEE